MNRPHLLRSSALIFTLALILSPNLFAEDTSTKAPKPKRDLPVQDIFNKHPAKVEAIGDKLEYVRDTKMIIARDNVVVRYEESQITADYAEVETETKKVHAKGHVIVFRKGEPIAQGDEIFYDFDHNTGNFPDGRALSFPWFIKGVDIQQVRKGVKVVKNGSITTCDLEKPHYDIRAKKVTIYDRDKIVAKNIVIYVLDKPIFWWPYIVIPLQPFDNLPFSVSAGYNSRLGTYIETTKGISINKNINGKLHADWRSERGFGGGMDVSYNYGARAKGLVRSYITQDRRAPTPGISNPYSETENRARGRVTVLHRTDIDPETNVILRYNRIADEYFLQDFFRKEHQAEIEPQSFVTTTHAGERFGVLAHVEKKANSFESIVERLPELRFDWKTQPFYKNLIFYQNQTSFANLNKTYSRTKDLNQSADRFDLFNEWSMPLRYNNVSITPFADVRGTGYNRELESDNGHFRTLLTEGLDVRTQYYKLMPLQYEKFGMEINDLRHVLEPYIQGKTQTSSVSDEKLQEFDSIDRLDDQNIIKLGAENRLQTKRIVNGRMQRVDVVSLNTFMSYEFHPDGKSLASENYAPLDDGRVRNSLTILSQEIVLRPYDWLHYETKFDYGMNKNEMRIFNQDVVIRKGRYKAIFGHRFVNQFGGSSESNQFAFDGSVIINPLWTLGAFFRWDAKQNDRKEWQVSATRDLHDFILDFGYNVRNSQIDSSNKTIFFDFRLKAFPILSLKGGGNRSSFSAPRIGETVAGSNPASETVQYS